MGTSGEKRPNPNVGRKEERDAHKNQHNTTLQKSGKKSRLKGKEQQKVGFIFFLTPTFCPVIQFKSHVKAAGRQSTALSLKSQSHTEIQSRDVNTRKEKATKRSYTLQIGIQK